MALSKTEPVIQVVVVFPCAPATAIPYLSRISSANISPLGITGFVNAAMELKAQIDEGLLPEPDYLYAALGSTGTVVRPRVGIPDLHCMTWDDPRSR